MLAGGGLGGGIRTALNLEKNTETLFEEILVIRRR